MAPLRPVGAGDDAEVVRCEVDPDHQRQLTREETTASVHDHETELSADSRAELVEDLRGDG